MVTSQGNYSIELHRDSPKSLPILPNLLHLPSQTVKVREYYRLRVEIPGLARFGDIVTPSQFAPDELERLITENKVEATDEKPIEERYEKFGGK